MKRLEGKVALVTGGLRGIGLAIGERYLDEGARVVLADLAAPGAGDVTSTLQRLGPGASYLQLDVAQESAWIAAEKSIRSAHGRLDVLVHNAGIDLTGAIESLEFSDWRRIMSINVDGVFLGTKTFTHLLGESGRTSKSGSSIINMSSIMGIVGMSEASAYNAGKGAVRLFTKAVALEYAKKGTPIRVNSIHPGFVRTPLLEIGMQKWVDRGIAGSVKELIDGLAASTPNGRLAEPSEIAGVAFFLASDDSSYCTGSEFVVDGGWTAQ
jgi:NAD(P)-dependent dehydrogenase (short-subunit alcohol dehydrogenase family)